MDDFLIELLKEFNFKASVFNNKLNYTKNINTNNSCILTGVMIVNKVKVLTICFIGDRDGGSIGKQDGNKIVAAINYARRHNLNVFCFVTSGGMRIQENTDALFQMSNIISSINKLSEKKLLLVSVLIKFVYGGIFASLVPMSDIIIAEENCKMGLTGPKIIKKTTQEEQEKEFQTANKMKDCGLVDIIINKNDMINIISKIVLIFK